jgi:excisionase family DNA binding protein
VIIGEHRPAMVLSAETAYWIEVILKPARLRQRLRDGRHQLVSQELLELRRLAMTFDPTQLPEKAEVGRDCAEVGPGFEQWLSVAEAADLLYIGERAVRLACGEDRLDADKVGGRWRVSRQAVEDFKAARAA